MSMEPLLKVRGLTKIYRLNGQQTAALSGVDLDIAPGEFTAIAGPSGSGKSTLLHLMGGLDHPSAGEVWLEGRRIDQLDHNALAQLRLRKLGFVFQSYNLIPVLTALENAAFVLELQGVGRRERETRARAALEDLGIGRLAGRRPNQLSGGEQQRVAVSRAMAATPRLILADEPTANLDGKTGGALIDEMRHLNREHGVTFVVATHDPRLLERVKRIVYLEDGRIVRDDGATAT
jgi:putative ABC transport system ATP-binding protein